MKKRELIALGWCAVLIFGGCQQQPFQPEAIQQDYLTLGKGGGMTNQVDTYYILSDGYVYYHDNFSETYERKGRLDADTRSAYFERAHALPDTLFGCQEPGNIYYFLSIHTPDSTRSCTWGSQHFSPPEDLSAFYRYSQSLIKNLSL